MSDRIPLTDQPISVDGGTVDTPASGAGDRIGLEGSNPSPRTKIIEMLMDSRLFKLIKKYAGNSEQEICRKITRDWAKSFYFSSFFLPGDKRKLSYVIYAFCRQTDYLSDDIEADMETRKKLLKLWKIETLKAFKGKFSAHPILNNFVVACNQVEIPSELALQLIEGAERDLVPNLQISSMQELDRYCYLVAGVPGMMMAYLLGFKDKKALESAATLGKALQYTNILRDVGEDLLRQRIYLPKSELRKFGYSTESLKHKEINQDFKNLIKHFINLSKTAYQEGLEGIKYLKSGKLGTLLTSEIYQEILSEIEKTNYRVFDFRAKVSFKKKFLILLNCLLKVKKFSKS